MRTTNYPLVLEYRGDPNLHRAGDLMSPGITREVADFLNQTGRVTKIVLDELLKDETKPLTLPTPEGYRYVHIPRYGGPLSRMGERQKNDRPFFTVDERQITVANEISAAIAAGMNGENLDRLKRMIPFSIPLPNTAVDLSTTHLSAKMLFQQRDTGTTRTATWEDRRALWTQTVCMAATIGLGKLLNEDPIGADAEENREMVSISPHTGEIPNIMVRPRDTVSRERIVALKNLQTHPDLLAKLNRY